MTNTENTALQMGATRGRIWRKALELLRFRLLRLIGDSPE